MDKTGSGESDDDSRDHEAVGPFGLHPAKDNAPFYFGYFLNPRGPAPSDEQLALALRIDGLMRQMYRFSNDSTAKQLAEQLRGVFQAGLVQASAADPSTFDRHVAAIEAEFLTRVVTPKHRRRVSLPTLWTAATLAITSIAGFALYLLRPAAATDSDWAPYLAVSSSLLFVVSGTLLGRLFFMVVTHQSMIESISQYDTDGARIGNGGFVIFLDSIVGVIAFLIFYTGFLQIAIGASEVPNDSGQVRSALSTLGIKSKSSAAYLFGLIVGIARAQFISRVTTLARERLQ